MGISQELKQDKDIIEYFIDNEYFRFEEENNKLGELIFKMETSHGLPIEIQVDKLIEYSYPKKQIACGILVYQSLLIEHKLKSGMGVEKIEKKKQHNRKIIKQFIKNGEIL